MGALPRPPGGSNAPGIVVRRQVGTVGSLTAWWSPEDEWVYPHFVSIGESHVFVAATRLFNPGLDSPQVDVRQLLFNPTDNDGPRPYFLGMREAAAGRNTGGLVQHDPSDGTFLASGISPNGYHPDWFHHPRTIALFRFAAVLAGEQPFSFPDTYSPILPRSKEEACLAVARKCRDWDVQASGQGERPSGS